MAHMTNALISPSPFPSSYPNPSSSPPSPSPSEMLIMSMGMIGQTLLISKILTMLHSHSPLANYALGHSFALGHGSVRLHDD
jgi:hypothetical protein